MTYLNPELVQRDALYDLMTTMRTPLGWKFAEVFRTEPAGVEELRGRIVGWVQFIGDVPPMLEAGGTDQHVYHTEFIWNLVIGIWANDPTQLDTISGYELDYSSGMRQQLNAHIRGGVLISTGVHALRCNRGPTYVAWAYDRTEKLYRRLTYPLRIRVHENVNLTD